MDGTLIDTTVVVPQALIAAVAELGGPPVDVPGVVAAYSLGVPEVVLAHLLQRPLAAGESEAYYQRLNGAHLQAFPGVLDTVAAVHAGGHRMAVFTGAAVRGARTLLAAAGVQVDVLVGGDLVAHPKPAPDGVHRVARLLDVPTCEVAYIGDSGVDLQAATAAGARAVAAAWGHLYDSAAPADHTLTHPSEALSLLKG